MGVSAETRLGDALFGRVRQRVLALLLGNPGRSYYANEVIRLVDSGTGAVQRELARLQAAGIVTVTRVGKQKHFQANPASPVFEELRGLVLKTAGMADALAEALAPLAGGIRAAFVFGSVARREDTAASDIDLMVISDEYGYGEVFAAIDSAAHQLGRPVNPRVCGSKEFARRVADANAFVTNILKQPKIWVIGGEHELLPAGTEIT